jgi:hypothetical protein
MLTIPDLLAFACGFLFSLHIIFANQHVNAANINLTQAHLNTTQNHLNYIAADHSSNFASIHPSSTAILPGSALPTSPLTTNANFFLIANVTSIERAYQLVTVSHASGRDQNKERLNNPTLNAYRSQQQYHRVKMKTGDTILVPNFSQDVEGTVKLEDT